METKIGQIVELGNKVCRVAFDDLIVDSSARGNIHHKGRMYVGDRVEIGIIGNGEFVINKIFPRKTLLYRPAIANLDTLLIICTCKQPEPDIGMLDRCLCAAEANSIDSVIIFNKADLLNDIERDYILKTARYYEKIGYQVITTGDNDENGTEKIRDLCQGRLSAFSGVSGAGKSTVMNRLLPHIALRTNAVSKGTQRGVHTTTSSVLIKIGEKGFIVDTPGFSALDIPHITEDSVTACFPDINSLMGNCRFNNCLHESESGCSVKDGVEDGSVAPWRLSSYHKIRHEIRIKTKTFK